jgi:hypothetical protein
MEKCSVETERIEIEAVPSQPQEAPRTDARINKEEIIPLLKKHGVTETKIVENPEIRAEDVIPTLWKAKVKVQALIKLIFLPLIPLQGTRKRALFLVQSLT